MKKLYTLADDKLELTHFRSEDEFNYQLDRLKRAFDDEELRVDILYKYNKINQSYRLILRSFRLIDLQKAVDIIFNKDRYDLMVKKNYVFLNELSENRHKSRNLEKSTVFMTCLIMIRLSILFCLLMYLLYAFYLK